MALWREELLAKNVLAGLTKGYKNHPQLDRFYAHENALEAVNAYLAEVYEEGCARGQIEYEFAFLQKKLKMRDFKAYERNLSVKNIEIAGVFEEVAGGIEPWERVKI